MPQAFAAGQPAIDPGFIVFGYLQNDAVLPHVRWNALTHIAGTFVTFNSAGSLTSNISTRDADMKAGGAAQAAGVKYIMVVNSFDDASGGAIQDVMTDYTVSGPKDDLIANIIAQMNADGYCAGVNFDIEFSWGASVRDGIADFLTKMRTAIDAQVRDYEMSIYVHPNYSSTMWNAPNLAANCDYILQSGYDYGSGRTAHAITDQNNNMTALNNWFNAGIPPEKMIYTISTYGRQWWNATAYNQTQPDNPANEDAVGFTDGKYNTTLRVANGGPFLNNYVTGDEVAWYTYDNGTSDSVTTWDNEASLEYKVKTALSFPGAGAYQGRRMKGVGFWSLLWLAEQTSRDPILASTGAYTRTYPHAYQLTQEALAVPGVTRHVFNKFEGLDFRWDGFSGGASNTPSPDNVNFSTASTRAIIAAPAGAGAPPNSTNAMRLNFTFTTPANAGKVFFRHEMLNSNIDTAVRDTNATNAHLSANSKVNAYVNVPSAYTGTTVRLVVIDSNRQLEASPATALNVAGWQLVSWDLVNTPATALTTAEPGFVNGNGVINTGGYGTEDISFVGFLVEHAASGTASGSIYFDELSYEASTPSSRQYVINEFHYNNVAREFVEIKGTVGAFPANLGLVFYDSATGAAVTTVTLGGQSMPAGGYFVVGDPGTANLNLTPAGWTAVANNIPNTEPTGIQLIDTVSGAVYDSVVYGAMGGLGDLVRRQTQGVVDEGFAWIGEGADGTNGASINYGYGRFPDGVDTQVNQDDFTYLGPTPGATNGGASVLGQTYDFTALPANLYQTYQLPRSVNPVTNGLPALTGNALRVIDLSGGGTQAFLHDPALGINAYTVTGNIYIPGTGAAAQAIAVGLAGRQGSTFFSGTASGSGYEDGYWLIYEQGTIDINDGQPAHNGSFQFVWATNDNMDAARTTALGTIKTRANVGVTAGQWTTFRLTVHPTNPVPSERLLAQINNIDVYRGDIPTDGPTTGSFQVGFRQTGAVTNDQGTWIDNLAFSSLAGVQEWSLY